MIIDMGIADWGKITLALVLFLGPGYALRGWIPGRRDDPLLSSKLYTLLLAFGLSASFWAVLLAWLNPLDARLSPAAAWVVSLAGWGWGLVRQAAWKEVWPARQRMFGDLSRAVLAAVLAVILLAGVWGVRDDAAGAGSDSYHHTLFAQMIFERGQLPDDYRPVTDQVVTFTYHFGYHAVMAVIGWLSGISLLRIVLLSGAVWVALAALSVAFLVERLTGSRWGGVIAATVTGLTCVFPTHMLTWGRYPQLTGLVLLPAWLGLALSFFGRGTGLFPETQTREAAATGLPGWRGIAILSLLSAGMGFAHYRVALITVAGFLTLIPFFLWRYFRQRAFSLWPRSMGLALAAAGCLLLFAPWLWHVAVSLQRGYPLVVGEITGDFFRLSRLGEVVLKFPTNGLLLGLTGLAAGLGLARRNWVVLWLFLWSAAVWIFSHPRLAAFFMDRISVFISLYIPLAIAIGWLAGQVEQAAGARPALKRSLFAVAALGLAAWSAPHYLDNLALGSPYLHPDDLAASGWIRENTPETAYFMVNLFHFPFSPDLIIGADGGYWLPLTAGRPTVTIPMSYMSEKFRTRDGIDHLKALDRLEGHLCTPEAVRLLKETGVTHVYLGRHGGNIRPQELLSCAPFELEYNDHSVYVFRFDSLRAWP
jgi:hypothetical protein